MVRYDPGRSTPALVSASLVGYLKNEKSYCVVELEDMGTTVLSSQHVHRQVRIGCRQCSMVKQCRARESWNLYNARMQVRVCLDSKILYPKTSNRIFRHIHGVLNKYIYNFFLHGWIINREMNLMSLLNS